jgi:hypothetical protein
MGDTLAYLGQRVELGDRGVREPIEPAAHMLEAVPLRQTLEIRARDAGGVQVAGAHGTASSKAQELGCLGGGHDTKRCMLNLYINVPEQPIDP